MDLFVDIESYSDVDLTKAGLYKYAQSPAFRVLLVSYSFDGGPVKVVDVAQGEAWPQELLGALWSPVFTKHAYNAAFEWYCLSQYFKLSEKDTLDWIPQWRDTMLQVSYCGYPNSLDAAGKALGLSSEKQKMSVGKALIRYFCIPCKPTKTNGGRTRNLPQHDPDKWALFKEYNQRDVETEMAIEKKLSAFPVPDDIQKQWETDLRINARGVAVDLELVDGALAIDAQVREELVAEAVEITCLDNPNSVSQLVDWLAEATGEEVDNLRKDTVKDMLASELPSDDARRVLEIRQELGKTSVKKYAALETSACADGRVRGILQFYGANRTGRWAGRIVQPQNLPRTYISGELLPLARDLVKARNADALRWIFGSVPDTLSQLIRTALVASPGHVLVDADFSAIEARVLAWLAGENWRLEVFRTHGKIYEASASQMFGVPMEKIKKGNPEYELRQRGKVAELALGYGGGVAAMRTMDTGKILAEVPDEEIQEIVNAWRLRSPAITRLWTLCETAALSVARSGSSTAIPGAGLVFAYEYDPNTGLQFMTIQLPSGRKLYYPEPSIGTNRFGRESVTYWGVNQTTRKWMQLETYGGKLVENITQAVARDCLAEAVERLEAAGYPVVFHVHDEVVIDARTDCLEQVVEIMKENPSWAKGLPLNADGWTDAYYKKD
jgi:DNA polymerase